MDLTIPLDGTTLNIRVTIIMETEKGFLIQKHRNGYYFFIGGRMKLNESSQEAAKREMLEETGLAISDFKLVSVIENFYNNGQANIQEITFVYLAPKIDKVAEEFGLIEVAREEVKELDIKPKKLKDIVLENNFENISHYII
jgi:8-oxo-dGTP pyrophosphatase MutT (NUDIX family)